MTTDVSLTGPAWPLRRPRAALCLLMTVLGALPGCGRVPSAAAPPPALSSPTPAAPPIVAPSPARSDPVAAVRVVGPPREVVAAQFNRPVAGFEEAGARPEALLGFEAVPFLGDNSGIYEVRLKVRLRVRGDTFRQVRPEAEFVRQGLITPPQAESASPDEKADYDPRLEAATRDLLLLEPVRRAGETLEVYGTMGAARFVDRWQFEPFVPRGLDPADLGRPRGAFPPAALVRGSPEAERLFVAAKAASQERLARLRQLEERARALVAPGRRYAGQIEYYPVPARPARPASATFEVPSERAAADALPAGSLPVALTITTVWPVARDTRTATPLRWEGQVNWRGPGYAGALSATTPRLQLGWPDARGRVPYYHAGGTLSADGRQLTVETADPATLRLHAAEAPAAAAAPR